MRRNSLALAAALALAAGGATAQELGKPGAASVFAAGDAEVLARPTDAEVAAAAPAKAQGSAVVHCRVDAVGALVGCEPTLERGAGLAAALIALAPKFRLKPDEHAGNDEAVITASWPPADVGPDWAVPPKPGDFMTTATEAAWKSAGGRGFVVMNCLEGTLGTLYRCAVVYQDPPGKGFGTMLLRFAAYLRLKPAMLNGKPVVTGVNIAFHFEKAARGETF
jgi:hypothetical protein